MKKLLIFWIFLFQWSWANRPQVLSVLPLQSKSISSSELLIVNGSFEEALFDLGKWSLISRDQAQAILAEQGFQASGCTDEDCSVKMGQLLGAEIILDGYVEKLDKDYFFSLRVVSVESGEMIVRLNQSLVAQPSNFQNKGALLLATMLYRELNEGNSMQKSRTLGEGSCLQVHNLFPRHPQPLWVAKLLPQGKMKTSQVRDKTPDNEEWKISNDSLYIWLNDRFVQYSLKLSTSEWIGEVKNFQKNRWKWSLKILTGDCQRWLELNRLVNDPKYSIQLKPVKKSELLGKTLNLLAEGYQQSVRVQLLADSVMKDFNPMDMTPHNDRWYIQNDTLILNFNSGRSVWKGQWDNHGKLRGLAQKNESTWHWQGEVEASKDR